MGQVTDLAALSGMLAADRASGRRIVLTNGHFDLLHVGHLRYLRAARALGDLLVVGMNDDACTRRLKGPRRPIVPEDERAELLAALDPVDWVVLFSTDTAVELVEALRPDIYVKGGDYTVSTDPAAQGKPLPEAAVVRRYGGEVALIPLVPGRSSSDIVARVVARYCV
ncbi:MAG TPA: adenylyltransferase/cytidyltransferase family protein [Thermomicrobiales bacterium]|jgi:rfaE bifunctional protein nucleotidyltransferase chain/domain